MSLYTMNRKERVAICITAIAGGAWLIDFATKTWARQALAQGPRLGIPHLLYFILGINHGGSNGIPSDYMELCLAVPAAIMFIVALTLGKSLRAGLNISRLQQVGLGLFLGGALGNWSERVITGGVTDFIVLDPLAFCVFNLADIFIDIGNLIFLLETARILFWMRARQRTGAGNNALDSHAEG